MRCTTAAFPVPKTYPRDVRIRAVALADATSMDYAVKLTGIPADTISRWVDEAPDQTDLERNVELALSEVTTRLASGQTRGLRDVATVYGILRDKLARYGRAEREPEPDPEQQEWATRLEAALADKYGIDLADDRADDLLDDHIFLLARWHHAEGPLPPEVWEDPAALVAALPDDWPAWQAERKGRQDAEYAEQAARVARSRPAWEAYMRGDIEADARDAWIRDGIDPFAAETAALIAEAEAFLRS